ncbi:(-)-isopiperitenol/(-)-carveol dehydrogenase, mitochondrial [Vitis vinifera]|uniref:(-)-isopiperitenol/(-)-carveol dehydrogenase, mitochondrial n=1 Tax=Vitis vinifera TaxID=29760 RepID=A0A438I3D9_VITVI|nr:(-)-isopiperitenol/(-)-carveol dehydrogenase, mitochondrial [Vitis vinifera]
MSFERKPATALYFSSHLHSSNSQPHQNSITDTTPFNNKPQGKVAIITGGASNIGEAMKCLFVDNGARAVVIADIQDELGCIIAKSISLHRCKYVHCDVTDE